MNAYSTTRTTTTAAKTTGKTTAKAVADSKCERLFRIFGNEVRRALEVVGAAYRNAPLRLL